VQSNVNNAITLTSAHQINGDKFTPVDSTLIPNSELKPVEGTPFDFRKPTAVGARVNADDEQIKFCNGYDHNWVIKKPFGQLALMATVQEPEMERVLEVLSTEPGLQFYSGNFLDGTITGKGGWTYQFRNAFAWSRSIILIRRTSQIFHRSPEVYKWIIPRWIAAVTASVRSATCNFARMLFRWSFAVCSVMFRTSAISLLAKPFAS
jgi:hypothetical protein